LTALDFPQPSHPARAASRHCAEINVQFATCVSFASRAGLPRIAAMAALALLAASVFVARSARANDPTGEPMAPAAAGAQRDAKATQSNDVESPAAAASPKSPGPVKIQYVLEGLEIRGNTVTLARVIEHLIPFRAGDALSVDDRELTLTRYRLLGTGFFKDVQLSLRRGSRRGSVVLRVDVVERNTLVLNDLWLGLATDAEPNGRSRPLTAYGGFDVSELNLAGAGIALGGAMVLADRQLALRTRISDDDFLRSSWTAEAELRYANAQDFFGSRQVLVDQEGMSTAQDYAVLRYRRFGGTVGAGHEVGSVATRVFVDYRFEGVDATLPAAASHKRGRDIEPLDFRLRPGGSLVSTVSATLMRDTRDDAALPTRGSHIVGMVQTTLAPSGGDYLFTKFVLRASRWMALPWSHVVRLEGLMGGVVGEAPLFETFYVGDYTDLRPHRALDLAFDRRAAPNFFGTSIADVRYGDYAARFVAEYRVPMYRGRRSVYSVDAFMSAGVYGVAQARDITQPARGYEGFAKVPIDLTFNAGLQASTAAGAFKVGIANLVGFAPIRSEGP